MFDIRKDAHYIYVGVSLKKREVSTDERIILYWRDCVEQLKKTFPDVDYEEKPEVPFVFCSFKEPHKGEWKFKIKQAKKNKKSKFSKKPVEDMQEPVSLTEIEKPATVEETAQTDLSEIVQEPTE